MKSVLHNDGKFVDTPPKFIMKPPTKFDERLHWYGFEVN